MSNARITKLMSHSLDQFDRNPRGHYTVKNNSWGLPPGAQLYKAAKLAIDEGKTYRLQAKTAPGNNRSGRNGHSVPPINPRGGMVSQGPYTSYKTKGNNPKDRYAVVRNDGSSGARSLPLDSNEGRDTGPRRRIGSAPGNKKQGGGPKAQQPKPQPKINTLVHGSNNNNDSTPRGPAGHVQSHATPRQEKVSDQNKSMREWEMVRAEPKTDAKKKDADTSISYHAKNNTSVGHESDVQEDLHDPPDTSRVIVMGGADKKPTRQKTRFESTKRDDDIRRTLAKRREERKKKEQQNLSMQRKNTSFYRSSLDDSRAPRRERTRQIARRKTELITRAKTKDTIRERNLKNFVAVPTTNRKDDIDMELYRIEQQMHIYLQTNGMYVDTSELSRLRPESRATDATGPSTTRSDTTLDTTKKSHKSAKKRNAYTDRNRNVPPWHRKEYVLNKREADMYQKINKVYRNDNLRENRENAFLKKVEALQVEEWKRLWYKYEDKLREREAKRNVMQSQLHQVRQKYADDRWERIAKFPVNRIAVTNDADRHEYGLPGDLNEESVNYQPKVGSDRKPRETFDSSEKAVKNKRRYDPIFDVYRRMQAKRRPKMEGVDVITIDDDKNPGGRKKRRVGVKSLVKDAEDMLDSDEETEWEDDDSPTHSPTRGTQSERAPASNRHKPGGGAALNRSRTSGPDSSFNRSTRGGGAGGAYPSNRLNRSFDPKYGAYGGRVNPRQAGAANRSMDSTRGGAGGGPKTRSYGPGSQAARLNDSELGKPGGRRFRSNVNDFRSGDPAAAGNRKRGGKAAAGATKNQDGAAGAEGDDEMEEDGNAGSLGANASNGAAPNTQVPPHLQNSATNSKESIASKSKKNGGGVNGGANGDGSSVNASGKQNADGSLNNSKDSGSTGVQNNNNKDSKNGTANNSKESSKGAKGGSKDAKSSGQSQGGSGDAEGTSGQSLLNGHSNTDGSGNQGNQGGDKSSKSTDTIDGQQNAVNGHGEDGYTSADGGKTGKDGKAGRGGKGKGGKGGKSGSQNGDANSSKNSNELASNSNESFGGKGGGSSQNGDSHNANMNKSILVGNGHDTTINGGTNANTSTGSDKENLKPKQGKTVRIISPEKPVARHSNNNTTRAVSPNIGKNRPKYNAPKAFEIKKSERKTTRAQSPKLFQKGAYKEPSKFELKKSQKELTRPVGPNFGPGDYTAPDPFEVEHESRTTRPQSPGRGGNWKPGSFDLKNRDRSGSRTRSTEREKYQAPKAFEPKKSGRATTRAQSPKFGRGDYKAPKAFETKKSNKSTRAESPNFGQGEYEAPKAFEPKKREKSGTRAQSPNFGRGDYKAPKGFETKKSDRSTTRAESPTFGRGEYKAPKGFETTKTERKVTRTQSPTFGQGDYKAPKAFEPRKREKAATRSQSPSLGGAGGYTAPKAFEPKKRERSGTRAQSPTFGRSDYKAPAAPKAPQRTRRTRKETTETTKTIRRRKPADYDSGDESGPDFGEVRKRDPPKRQRAPPRRSEKTGGGANAAATQDPQRPDVPTPDLATDTDNSDDDIFEKAKRKYGIVLDDSD